ncbi:Outer membrane protein beta-barrel [uncultured Caudovirales phage]|uniref:Outer membrane protein beta-barrel n=1 Tax=uncultured Caudovirales phage TaxID=2100421 RepID=A0A6J5M8N4_9CAUD|nr:Outer membrane protein beta-barrel [uncultured Caudovirales phage]
MKKVVLFAMAMIAAVTVTNAQNNFKKADKFVEGTVSYTKSNDVDASYGIQPTFGYFLTNRFAVGASANFAKDVDGVKTTGIAAFGRCYILNIGQNLKTFSQLNVGTATVNDGGIKTSAFGVNIGLGVNYFVSPKLALSLNVADLVNYTSVENDRTFTIGWEGVENPFSAARFGVLYRF